MANKETRIYKTDTLEKLRQKSNEISLHLGDNEQLNALMADKTYIYSASAGQTLFAGPDTSSPAKTSRFETSPAHTIDNTAGYIILESVSSLACVICSRCCYLSRNKWNSKLAGLYCISNY